MLEAILNETTTVSNYDIAAREHVVREVRLVDLEREQLGAEADGLTDEEIAQIILDRRQAEQDAAQQAEYAIQRILDARAVVGAFDVSALDDLIAGVSDGPTRAALRPMRDLIAAVAVLVR